MIGRRRGRIIYLAGNDGTGKTTQAELLLKSLRRDGVPASYVWLRFPQYLSIPVLALSRFLGTTRYRIVAGQRVGGWEFDRMPWLATLLLWCQVIDVRIARRLRIDPLTRRGEVVVLDRFVFDIAIDIASAAHDDRLLTGKAAHLLFELVSDATTFVLDAPAHILVERRLDLGLDARLPERARLYRALARQRSIRVLDTVDGVDAVHRRILDEGVGHE